MIEQAYRFGEQCGLSVWTEDEAGPYQAIPQAGKSWRPQGQPGRQPHEYARGGTAKLLTLFHPATGQLRVHGVRSSCNAVLHPWLKEELRAIVAALPPMQAAHDAATTRALWQRWQAGLSGRFTLLQELPPLRMLLVWDNLAGHKTPELLCWLMAHGIMPLYTPLAGSWLNMAESIQRILAARALSGQHPSSAQHIIDWLEATARGWNSAPTPFVWGGKRQARRQRARQRRYTLGGSGACTLSRVPCHPEVQPERLCA